MPSSIPTVQASTITGSMSRAYPRTWRRARPTVRPIDRGSVIPGGGPPGRPSRSFVAMESRIATIDVAACLPLSLVSAHETIRIKGELRRERQGVG